MKQTRLPSGNATFRVDPSAVGPQVVLIDDSGRGLWIDGRDVAAIQAAVDACPPYASWCCPHCLVPGPHQHAIDRKGFVHAIGRES